MQVIKPIQITPSKLLSTNVPENDHPEWVSGTTYSAGQRVIRGTLHYVYERVISGSGTVPPESDTTNWVFVSYTNRWKMFDQKGGSVTTNASTIDVTIKPNSLFTTLCLLGVNANSLQVIMTDAVEGEVFNETMTLVSYFGVTNWWRYFFEPIVRKGAVFVSLPNYSGADVRIILTGIGDVSISSLIIGAATEVGDAQYGTSVGITSYSIKERDKFGNISIVPRPYSDKARYNLKIPPSRTDYVKRYLTSIRDVPCVFVGSTDYESSVVYGFYKDLDLTFTSFAYSDYTLEVEGLV